MVNIRITNITPSVNSKNTVPSSRLGNTQPNVQNKSIVVFSRVSIASSNTEVINQSGSGITFGGKAYLIGMMAMTYIAAQTTGATTTTLITNIGPRPNVRLLTI